MCGYWSSFSTTIRHYREYRRHAIAEIVYRVKCCRRHVKNQYRQYHNRSKTPCWITEIIKIHTTSLYWIDDRRVTTTVTSTTVTPTSRSAIQHCYNATVDAAVAFESTTYFFKGWLWVEGALCISCNEWNFTVCVYSKRVIRRSNRLVAEMTTTTGARFTLLLNISLTVRRTVTFHSKLRIHLFRKRRRAFLLYTASFLLCISKFW